MAGMRVLFDTNVISYMLSGDDRFKSGLQKTNAELRKRKATKLISVITIQELEVWARFTGDIDVVREYLSSNFTALIFDVPCAREAARLASLVERPSAGNSGERRQNTDRWHRDAGIAATASHHGLSAIFTANHKDFAPFQEHMIPEIMALPPA